MIFPDEWRRSRTLRILPLSSLLGLSVMVSVFLTPNAHAEWYVGAYGGLTNPGAFSNTTLSSPTVGGGVTDARINDLELKSNLVGGLKAGYFFNARPWLGIETDLYTRKPDVKQQTIFGGTTGGRVFADNLPTTSLRLTTWAFNIIIRSPSMGDIFQPYGGMGYGLFLAKGSLGGHSDTHVTPGFQLVAGARILLTPKWALFGEFKFDRATIRFSDLRGNYSSQIFALGVMLQFK
ncbi:MAG TPA: porin family protein [Nitrospirales bacterium]|jgi:opacity protein-like surface antigen